MLMPLSKSFNSLKKRMQCISINNSANLIEDDEEEYRRFFGDVYELKGEMSIDKCLEIFDEKQALMSKYMQNRSNLQNASEDQGLITGQSPSNYFA